MVTLLVVWFYWLIIVLMSTCECFLLINGIELKWFLVWIVETRTRWVVVFTDLIHLDYCQCLLVYWTPSVPCSKRVLVAAGYPIHPQGIDESLKWFKFVHFNIWLWQLKTHGHNVTWRSHWDTFMVSSLSSNNSNCLLQDTSDMGYNWYESLCSLFCGWSVVTCCIIPIHVLTGYVNYCARIAKCNCWGSVLRVFGKYLVSVPWKMLSSMCMSGHFKNWMSGSLKKHKWRTNVGERICQQKRENNKSIYKI